MREFIAVTKALADENRVRILRLLVDRELCVCQIVGVLGLAPSTISKHLAILAAARLVESHKEGRWVHYRLAGTDSPPMVRYGLGWLTMSLGDDAVVSADQRRLAEVLTIPKETLCGTQARR